MTQKPEQEIREDRDTDILAPSLDNSVCSVRGQYTYGVIADNRKTNGEAPWQVSEPSIASPAQQEIDFFAEIDLPRKQPANEPLVPANHSVTAECRNPNHPKLGDTIKVDPIRSIEAINRIKQQLLATSPRNFALFVVGINTAYRASELLSLRIGQVRPLQPGDRLEVKQKKTKKYRAVTINCACYQAFQTLLTDHQESRDKSWLAQDAYLFAGRRPDRPLLTSTLNNLVKRWCCAAELNGNFGSHSLRKTWGFMQRTQQDASIPLLMRAFGHSTQQQTLAYLCIQDEEIDSIYTSLEL